MPMTKEQIVPLMAFLEHSRSAHMITYSTATKLPLFAIWVMVESYSPRVLILWAGEPSHETRMAAEHTVARMLLDEVKAYVERKDLPDWAEP